MKTAGIDGCKAGWILIDFSGKNSGYRILRDDDMLEEAFREYEYIFIDIPIGIPDESYVRTCDQELRKTLGPDYSSSVFNPPIRPALYAPTYAEACMQSYSFTEKKVSLQAWNIVPRIRTVDQLLQQNESLRDKIFESHPELLFKRLNGDTVIAQRKQTDKGLKHRRQLVAAEEEQAEDFYRSIKEEFRRNEVAEDDIVDAMALAHFAKRAANGEDIKTLPKDPPADSEGLKMAIHYL